MGATIIDGNEIARQMRAEMQAEIESLKDQTDATK